MSNINDIARIDFMSYANAVIKHRAIPNIEDNLKPVHRRILFSLYNNKLFSNKKTQKCARIVGDTMGTLHPHGDSSIYDALVRLSQPWKMRYPLVEIQGNKGSISGAGAAASRYTETRLSPYGEMMVEELKEDSVPFIFTYDEEGKEPEVMPSAFPNILANGNMGIAVGMSSALLPHNINEVADVISYQIDNPNCEVEELVEIMPAPDFPTGGIIANKEDMLNMYKTGSGVVDIQGKYHIEEILKQKQIVFTEIPYNVTIESGIVSKIKNMVLKEDYKGIYNIENNTGHNGLEIKIILEKGIEPQKVLRDLLSSTGLQNKVRMGMTVLKNGQPIETNLKGLINGYIEHRHNVIIRVAKDKKEKSEKRLHIVEGMLIALKNIDGIIKIVKTSANKAAAAISIRSSFKLSVQQANAVLDMKVSQLNKLDSEKLNLEASKLKETILELEKQITSKKKRNELIKEKLESIKSKFGDERKTEVRNIEEEEIVDNRNLTLFLMENSELMATEKKNITYINKGNLGKRKLQKKPIQIIDYDTKNKLIMFDDTGRVYKFDPNKIETNYSIYINSLDDRIKGKVIHMMEVTPEDMKKDNLVIFTKNGIVKKSKVEEYKNFKPAFYAIKLKKGDQFLTASFADEDEYALMLSSQDKIVKFSLNSFSSVGRYTIGSRGMLADEVISATTGKENDFVITYSSDKAKKSKIKSFTTTIRGGAGQVVGEGTVDLLSFRNNEVFLLDSKSGLGRFRSNQFSNKHIKSVGTLMNRYGIAGVFS